MRTGKIIFSLCLLFAIRTKAQQFIPLWPEGKIPNTKGLGIKDSVSNERYYKVGTPGIFAFSVSKDDNNHGAVVIFPGGGYNHIAANQSGFQLAKWFNTLGMSAYVVIYRLPKSPDISGPAVTVTLQDAQRAIKIVRANAAAWGIDKNKIGVQGTSAGGHLAATMGTMQEDLSAIRDSLDTISFRPDFMILVSPVIDMGSYAHKGSRTALLGAAASDETIRKYSPQNNVTAATPPCFIADAFNDKTVDPHNSLLFYTALLDKNIPASFHVFPQGGHSINISNNVGSTYLWKELCEMWLRETGFIVFDKK